MKYKNYIVHVRGAKSEDSYDITIRKEQILNVVIALSKDLQEGNIQSFEIVQFNSIPAILFGFDEE